MDHREQAKVSFLAKICPEVWQGRDFRSFQFLNVGVCYDSIWNSISKQWQAMLTLLSLLWSTQKRNVGKEEPVWWSKYQCPTPYPRVTRNCHFRCSGICFSSSVSLIHSAFNHLTKKKFCQGLKRNSVEHLFQWFLGITGHHSEREVCQIFEGHGTNPGQGWKQMKMQLKADVCSLGWHPWWLYHHPMALCTCQVRF